MNRQGERKSPQSRLFLQNRDVASHLVTITSSSFNQSREHAESAIAFTLTLFGMTGSTSFNGVEDVTLKKLLPLFPARDILLPCLLWMLEQRTCSQVFRINKNLNRNFTAFWTSGGWQKLRVVWHRCYSRGYRKTSSGGLLEIHSAETAQYFPS